MGRGFYQALCNHRRAINNRPYKPLSAFVRIINKIVGAGALGRPFIYIIYKVYIQNAPRSDDRGTGAFTRENSYLNFGRAT